MGWKTLWIAGILATFAMARAAHAETGDTTSVGLLEPPAAPVCSARDSSGCDALAKDNGEASLETLVGACQQGVHQACAALVASQRIDELQSTRKKAGMGLMIGGGVVAAAGVAVLAMSPVFQECDRPVVGQKPIPGCLSAIRRL